MDTLTPQMFWPADAVFAGPNGRAAYGKYQQAALAPLGLVLHHAARFSSLLHGGGHIGLLSLALATRFQQVRVFEAAADNYAWLAQNVAAEPRIVATYGALGDGQPSALIRQKYSTTHYVRGQGDVPCWRIDALELPALDVLLLDTEGSEVIILQHALETIRRYHPVIIAEEWPRWMKRYSRQPGDVTRLLAPFGYRTVGKTDLDMVYVVEG